MNCYATLDDLKALLKVTTAEDDEQLLRLLKVASRQIEQPRLAGRYFYCYDGTKYFDGTGPVFWLPEDILSITTLKCDTNGDGTFEDTYTTTDYILYPLSSYPKIRLEININGSYASFASGIQKGIEITGVFGYADSATPYEAKTAINEASGITASQIQFTVDSGNEIEVGQTIRIESEQMFITDISGNELYVQRGVNGTMATTHADDKAVYVYKYPENITHACLILAMRAWKRKDSAYQDIVGLPETGQVISSKGIDPDVIELVAPYRRQEYW